MSGLTQLSPFSDDDGDDGEGEDHAVGEGGGESSEGGAGSQSEEDAGGSLSPTVQWCPAEAPSSGEEASEEGAEGAAQAWCPRPSRSRSPRRIDGDTRATNAAATADVMDEDEMEYRVWLGDTRSSSRRSEDEGGEQADLDEYEEAQRRRAAEEASAYQWYAQAELLKRDQELEAEAGPWQRPTAGQRIGEDSHPGPGSQCRDLVDGLLPAAARWPRAERAGRRLLA